MMIFIQCSSPVQNNEEKERIISSHEVWNPRNNPIIINRDITVSKSGTLEILPGTVIYIIGESVLEKDPSGDLYRNPRLDILGKFICQGSASEKISFKLQKKSSSFNFFEIMIVNETDEIHNHILCTEFDHVWYINGSINFSYCKFNHLMIESCNSIKVFSNTINELSVIGGIGTIADNFITQNICVQRDSINIVGNTIQNSDHYFGAICCHNFSYSTIEKNDIENCNLAFDIFASTPLIQYNNIIDNQINIRISPDRDAPQLDTIYVINNWWGTTDSVEIANRIVFDRNGETESGKTVIFSPFLKEPVK